MVKRINNLRHIVTVHDDRIPSECPILFRKVTEGGHLLDGTVRRQTVKVYNSNQIIELQMRGVHSCLPHRALRLFSVSHQHINFAFCIAFQLQGGSNSAAYGQSVAKAPGGNLNKRVKEIAGVHGEHAFIMSIFLVDLFDGETPEHSLLQIKQCGSMPL